MKKNESPAEYISRITQEFPHAQLAEATCQCGGAYVLNTDDGFPETGCTHCDYGH